MSDERILRSKSNNPNITIMKHCIHILGIIAIATSITCGQEAEKPRKGGDPLERFKKIDTDKDGVISLEEFKATPMGKKLGDKAEAVFQKIDADKSGGLTPAELKAAHEKRGRKDGGKKKGQ